MSSVRSLLWLFCLVILTPGLEGQGVKRSDDPNALEQVVQQLSATVTGLQAKVTGLQNEVEQLKADKGRRVAFSAYISANIAASSGSIVPFHRVITNVGSAYNSATGVFTCPHDGQYVFLVDIDVTHDYDSVSLVKNGHAVAYADHDDTVSTSLTASTVLTLHTGDTVYVVQHSSTGRLDSGNDCLFSGFLIK